MAKTSELGGLYLYLAASLCLSGWTFAQAGATEEKGALSGDLSASLEGHMQDDPGPPALRAEAAETYQGRASLRLEGLANSPAVQFARTTPFVVEPDVFYVFRGFIKGRNMPEKGQQPVVVFEFSSSEDSKAAINLELHTGHYWGEFPAGDFDWTPLRYYFKVPEKMDRLRVRLAALPGAVLFYNDAKIIPVPIVKDLVLALHNAVPVAKQDNRDMKYLTDAVFRSARGVEPSCNYTGLDKGITLSIELPHLVKVDRIVLFLLRHNCGHKLRSLELQVNKYGQWLKAGDTPGYWTEDFDQRLWTFEIPVQQVTDGLKVRFVGVGYLAPSKVLVVQDTPATVETARTGDGPPPEEKNQ